MSKTPDEKRQELDEWNARMLEESNTKQLRMQWLVSLYEAEGVELPYYVSGTEHITQHFPHPKKWDDEKQREVTDYSAPQVIDTVATKKILAKVLQHATKLGFKVEKKHTEDYYSHVVILKPDTTEGQWDDNSVTITYQASRKSVCQRVVTGTKRVEEQVTPAHEENTYEWVCEKISYLTMDTSSDSE